MQKRLATRLILSLTIIVVIVEGVSGLINIKTQERQLLDAMILGADQLSRGITSATWHAMLADHRETAYQVMETIAQKQGIRRIRIFNKEGRIMFSTDPNDGGQVDKDAEACAMCHSTLRPLVRVDVPSRSRIFKSSDGRRELAMVSPIYNEPACSDAACHAHPAQMNVLGVLDVALSLADVDSEIRAVEWRVASATAVHIVLIGIFIVVFTRRFVDRPIRKLIDGTRAVSQMQLDRPIEIESGDELGELARSFNLMRDRLSEAIAEINEFTQQLETKVAERTLELEVAHQKLEQNERLASLGRLSATVAHEINNPLSGVLNLSMLMERILRDGSLPASRAPEFQGYLAQVTRETTRIARIVSGLLAFSRRAKPLAAPTDLNRVIQSALSAISHKLQSYGVNVTLELDPHVPEVPGDGGQLQQVMINLLVNAAEATQTTAQKQVTVSTSSTPERILIKVSDNGEGIPQQHLHRIFDPFFTTKEAGKGVGLGLAVVYGIIASHGGEIDVESQPREGTTFTVRLPLTLRDSPRTAGPTSASKRDGGMREA